MNIKNTFGDTSLCLAAYKGNIEIVEALVTAGADAEIAKTLINVKNNNKENKQFFDDYLRL